MNDDFDMGLYERDKLEQQKEKRIGDEVSGNSEASNDDEAARDVPVDEVTGYPRPADERVVRDVPFTTHVDEVMPVRTLLQDATPYDSWVRLREAQNITWHHSLTQPLR